MTRRAISAWVICALALGAALPASAHRFAPAYLELTEGEGAGEQGAVQVLWRVPRQMPRGARLQPVLPCPRAGAAAPAATVEGTAMVLRFALRCAEARESLVGAAVGIQGLAGSGTSGLLRVALRDGREFRTILTSDAPRFTVPARESRWEVLRAYFALGAEHLFGGPDHMLFVLGLLGLLGATRTLALAITAFTVGHSFTLALAVLGFARLPSAPVEAAIAFSLVVMAVELARPADAPRTSWLRRRPGWMPFAFGLLHGLGFAGALSELGLPAHAIPLALFAFNVGIEAGQLAVVACALPLLWLLTHLRFWESNWCVRLRLELPATVIGGLGAYWLIARIAELF